MPAPTIPAVHLAENFPAAKRSLTTARAYPLGEPDRPTHANLETIVRYLDVETAPRYQRTATQTFCNIYACDYCYLAGAYLPRVWWTPSALTAIAAARPVPVKYADTVTELNANSLHTWLRDFGPSFGWTQATTLDQLQSAANAGQVAIICAQRKPLTRSGHIAMIVPDPTPPAGARGPFQSQAGRVNYRSSRTPGRWWESPQFQAHAFWIHPSK